MTAERPTEAYTHGHHASVIGQHARRTAESDAAFLLARLHPGMRLLDVGSGPGSITAGLARAVAPGAAVGIDPAQDAIEAARALAADEDPAGLEALTFEPGSAYELRWPDGSFDVAHLGQVLHHLARPVDALREVRRVVAPGGLVAAREVDYATMVHWPRSPNLERWLALYHELAYANGAEPAAGRRLAAWVREAGFEDLEVGASPILMDTRERVENWGLSWAERVTQSGFAEQSVAYGLATPEDLERLAEGWRAWTREPDAFFMYVNVEVIGRVP